MASAENMLERYKKEAASLLERCLAAEDERDLNDRLYNHYSKEYFAEQKKNEELQKKYDELQERFNRAMKVIEDHMEVDDAEF